MRETMIAALVLLAAHLLTGCCCPGETEIPDAATTTPTTGSDQAGGSIRAVDFRNFEYTSGDLGTFRTTDGEYTRTQEDIIESYTVGGVSYGDVDGNGGEEAIVVTSYNGGGTGQFDQGLVYTMQGGRATLLTTIPGGDRGDGGLESIAVANGEVTVRRLHSTDEDGACCPSQVMIESWKWSGGKLVQDTSKTRTEALNP